MKAVLRPLLAGTLVLTTLLPAGAADIPSTKITPLPVAPPSLFSFSDTTLSYRFEPNAKEPGVFNSANPRGTPIFKNIASITHVDSWVYGTNFANIDFLKSNGADPASPSSGPFTGQGALEVVASYRGTLSGNALSHSRLFSLGPIKDVALGFGGDLETKNTAFAPQKRDLVIGPQIAFDVPGYLTIEANVYKEWNHDSFSANPGGNVSYNAVPEFETTYMQPLRFTGLPLTFSGFANVVLPRGKLGSGLNTRTELLTASRLTLDIGDLIANRPHVADIFIGYKYWLNKFANNAVVTPGAVESTIFAGVAFHVL